MINLQGKVAVITGSSRGIGKSIALELAKHGAYIVLNGRNQSRLESAKLELCDSQKYSYDDVSEISQSNELIKTAVQHFGKLDILINNVGISMRGDVADLNPEVFKTVFESNVFGAVYPTIPAIKNLEKQKVVLSLYQAWRELEIAFPFCVQLLNGFRGL